LVLADLQLRHRAEGANLNTRTDKGVAHFVAIAAEEMLLRKELARFPVPAHSPYDIIDDGFEGHMDEEVQEYFDKKFGAYIAGWA
jgi:hypothetical protein